METKEMHGASPVGIDFEAVYDVAVLGSGPAGLNAALYARRKGLSVALVGQKHGGQVMDTASVENYLGFSFQTGAELVGHFSDHVASLEVPTLKDEPVSHIEKTAEGFALSISGGRVLRARTLIAATGSTPRPLGVEGEQAFKGRGVAYCAICDGPLFQGLDVIVAGGGNSAVEAAIDLSKVANTVKLVHRSAFRADQIVIDKLNALDNVEVYLQTQIQEIVGEQLVTGVRALDKQSGEEKRIEANGVFVEIGYLPNTELFKDWVALNERGEIEVNALCETSVPGLFAAGDVTDVPYKQIVIAAGEGAKAALSVNDYLNRG